MKIGDTRHSSEFGNFNLMCHTCGTVGYFIDCDLTYLGKFFRDGLTYHNFSVSNLNEWICNCPAITVGLIQEGDSQLTIDLSVKAYQELSES